MEILDCLVLPRGCVTTRTSDGPYRKPDLKTTRSPSESSEVHKCLRSKIGSRFYWKADRHTTKKNKSDQFPSKPFSS